MPLLDRLPRHLFSQRGWGLLASGAVSLLAAQILGRRDLLSLSVLLIALPLASLAGVRLLKPGFRVSREFRPSPVETAAATTVRLAVARTGFHGGSAIMEERLPPRFGESPAFRFPARSAAGGTSRYEYRLRCSRRGQYLIGPVTAEFTDPFGLSLHRRAIDDGDTLTVTPAAVELPDTGLAGARGDGGIRATRARANPSDDDVMTREYRPGDPMRRVHWAATAHHGALMVRQEEAVTTPEATVILDQRSAAFPGRPGPGSGSDAAMDGHEMPTSAAFEWAVVAAVSICTHLAERNYALRVLDPRGEPAFHRSPSAAEPEAEEFRGTTGLQAIAESLAAIQLSGPPHPNRDHGGTESPDFDDHLLDKLAAHRMRGPIIAVLGRISPAEARALAPAAGYGANSFAIIVSERTAETDETLETLRRGGWRAVAVTASVSVPEAWGHFDQGVSAPATGAADVRRGAGVVR